MSTLHYQDAARCAEAIIECVGRDVRLAVPIGIGKPILLLNALYRLAETDRRITLTIFTGLTLSRPCYRTDLERRFAEPLLDRLFATYPEPLYVASLRQDRLPANITVNEFFLQAGAWLTSGPVQRTYISLNYSHVAQYLERAGTNVFAQLVAPHRQPDSAHVSLAKVSLGGNTDVTLDMLPYITARRKAGQPVVVAGEVNANLPYMPGPAEMARADFDVLLEPEGVPYDLFAPPKEPVSLTDHAMGLYAATLIRDGGTLQVGIGSFADALTHALILRHQRNDVFRALLAKLGVPLPVEAELAPFVTGLYGCTEILVDGFLALKKAGILKRTVLGADGARVALHAGFFVGNRDFYAQLRAMPADELAEIGMTAISFTNTLGGDAARKIAERTHARFVNTAMVATLLGAVSSDALEDGRVVSGVGGQHDLISMAHALPGARSILAVRASRRTDGRLSSNVVWSYGNTTVPRPLRDIVVTEYGIADLKGRSDRNTIAAMLGVTDSAFQPRLLVQAQRAGKLESGYAVPGVATQNHAARIEAALGPAHREGVLPDFPLGSDMTDVEQSLVGPLSVLKVASKPELLRLLLSGLTGGRANGRPECTAIERLGLASPTGLLAQATRLLVLGALRQKR